MDGLIKASDFMDHLKANDLVIVSRKDLLLHTVTKRELARRDLLKKTTLSLREILLMELLTVKSKQGIRDWIASGRIKPEEVFKDAKGELRILTSAVVRLSC